VGGHTGEDEGVVGGHLLKRSGEREVKGKRVGRKPLMGKSLEAIGLRAIVQLRTLRLREVK
jgi:hypothetical protein